MLENDSCVTIQQEMNSSGYQLSLAARVLEGGLLVLIGLFSLITNVMLWATVLRFQRLRSLVNLLLLSHAFSQLLDASISLSLTTHSVVMGKLSFGCSVCQMMGFITTLNFVVNITSLAALSINRYIRVCREPWYPIIYNNMSIGLHIMAIWLTGSVWASGPLVDWGQYEYTPRMMFCSLEMGRTWRSKVTGAALYVIMVIIMICCYIAIFYKLNQQKQEEDRLQALEADTLSQPSQARNLHQALMQSSGLSMGNTSFKGKQLSMIEEVVDSEMTNDRYSINQGTIDNCPTAYRQHSVTTGLKVEDSSKGVLARNPTVVRGGRQATGSFIPSGFRSSVEELSKASSDETDKKKKRIYEMRFATALLTATIAFCVSILPIVHFTFLNESADLSSTWKVAFLMLAYFNNMVNPVIYAWGNSHIRHGFRMMYRDCVNCMRCKVSTQVEPS